MVRRATGGVAVLVLAALAGACGGDPIDTSDPAIQPFVGTWDADSLTLTNDTIVADILDAGGSFFITVEESGQYTATIEVLGSANPEIGQITVLDASTLRLTPSFPADRPSATVTYFFAAPDSLILDGQAEFDINFDGTPEVVEEHLELSRR